MTELDWLKTENVELKRRLEERRFEIITKII